MSRVGVPDSGHSAVKFGFVTIAGGWAAATLGGASDMAIDPLLMARLLVTRERVRSRDRWSRPQLLAYQQSALRRLLRHAATSSPYYRSVLSRGEDTALTDVPVLTKSTLMDHWDRVCTVRGVCLVDAERRLEQLEQTAGDPGPCWRGRWWLAATGGTTGRRAVIAWDRREWTQVLASYSRVNDWAGVHVGLRDPLRTAIVSSLIPTHQSAVVGASLRSSLVPTLRLDAREPVEQLAADLDRFNPRLLVAYASLVGPLAHAQLNGMLHVHPQKVVAASEVLGADARAAARLAWGKDAVVDTYAATETAGIASTCAQGGWHVYEDFVIVEPVDDAGHPVPPGTTAARLLVTVLFSRTLPLIRYELTDSIRLAPGRCACGLPFALLESVEGRSEDTITLAGTQGLVRVHPNVFHAALETAAPNGWQVEQQPDRLLIRLVEQGDTTRARAQVLRALAELAVVVPVVDVVGVPALERTQLGKIRLVKALHP